ncbi:hypothetical protein [Larkinella harenae]
MNNYSLLKKLARILPVIMGLFFFWVALMSFVERAEIEFDLLGIGGVFLVLYNIQSLLLTNKQTSE